MSFNLYRRLRTLLPDAPLVVGSVVSVTASGATVQLPDGSQIAARGGALLGQKVFVRDGLIEGPAPSLPTVLIEV